MGALLGFFSGPAQLKGLIIAAGVMIIVCLSLLTWGLWWRGEAYQATAERDVLRAQSEILAAAVKACSDGVDQAKRAGDAAVAAGGALLEAARRIKAPVQKTVERIETIIEKPAPAGAGCDRAWDAIEAERKGRAP